VRFEMLTGRRLFEGEDVSDTLASVLRAEPRWSALPADTPAPVRTLLRRCLERDVSKRLPHIGVARLELAGSATDEAPSHGVTAHRPEARAHWRTHAAWAAVAAAALASGVALSTRTATSSAAPRAMMRFEVTPPDGLFFPGANGVPRFAVSPDGAAIAFAVTVPGQRDALYIRRLSELEARPLNGTDTSANGGDAQQQPFFSPDGRFVAYFSGAESALKRVPVAGGPVERLATLPTQNCGGTWRGDVILVASAGTKGIQRLPASGGPLAPVTTLDQSRGEVAHLWPQFLPDGEHFIYLAVAGDTTATYVGSLTGGAPIKLVETPAMSRFAAPDRLLFVRGEVLLSQAVDMQTFTLVGEPVVAFDGVMGAPNTRVGVSTSENGVAVMASGRRDAGRFEVWSRGRAGQALEPAMLESPVQGAWVRLSPDGRSLAFTRGPSSEVWVKDLARGIVSRVSTSGRGSQNPVWTPDGRRLIYRSDGAARGRSSLHVRDVAGLEAERLLHEAAPGDQVIPEDVSPDGRHLLFRNVGGRGNDLLVLALDGSTPPRVYLSDGFRNRLATFSPDGTWVAYTSDENGQPQIFVRSFPDPSRAKHQVSNDGASYPRWSRDGRELFFVDQLNRVSVAPVDLRAGFSSGHPTPMFEISPTTSVTGGVSLGGVLDVFPDGQRFAIVAPRTVTSGVTLTVAVNWMAELTK
jgi:Tol biopolymer transport system component